MYRTESIPLQEKYTACNGTEALTRSARSRDRRVRAGRGVPWALACPWTRTRRRRTVSSRAPTRAVAGSLCRSRKSSTRVPRRRARVRSAHACETSGDYDDSPDPRLYRAGTCQRACAQAQHRVERAVEDGRIVVGDTLPTSPPARVPPA